MLRDLREINRSQAIIISTEIRGGSMLLETAERLSAGIEPPLITNLYACCLYLHEAQNLGMIPPVIYPGMIVISMSSWTRQLYEANYPPLYRW